MGLGMELARLHASNDRQDRNAVGYPPVGVLQPTLIRIDVQEQVVASVGLSYQHVDVRNHKRGLW